MEDISVQTSPPKKRRDKRTKALMNPEEYRLMLAKRREAERVRREKNPEYFKEKQKKANQRTKEKKKEMQIIMRLFMNTMIGLYAKDPDLISKLETEYEANLGEKLSDTVKAWQLKSMFFIPRFEIRTDPDKNQLKAI